MLEAVLKVLQQLCQVKRDTGLLVGVSGGPDSLCLLDILYRLDYTIVVGHFDHGLRSESVQDAVFVQHFAEERNLPFVTERTDAAVYAAESRLSIEEAARILRYRFLFRQAHKNNLGAVAVAHSADDQVETILMHFLRGSGISGLKGMEYCTTMPEWDPQIPLIRPLLDCWRKEILDYCQERGLHPLQDASNLSLVYQRNRIRHQLIPELETYNPKLRQGITRMAATLRDDQQILQDWVENTWRHCVLRQGEGFVEFSLDGVSQLRHGEKRSLMRYAILQINPTIRDLTFDALERGAIFAGEPHRGKMVEIGSGIILTSEGDRLVLYDSQVKMPDDDYPQTGNLPVRLTFPGEIKLENGWVIRTERLDRSPEVWSPDRQTRLHAWLDSDSCGDTVFIRPVQPGDRIQPLGMDGASTRISDMFINEKIPRRWRGKYPLIVSDDGIVWVPGLRIGHPFRCTPHTRTVIHLWMVKQTDSPLNQPGDSVSY